MNIYDTLRFEAEKRRDELIEEARAEYTATLGKIRELQRRVGMPRPKRTLIKGRTTAQLLEQYLPRDRFFRISELLELMNIRHPDLNAAFGTIKAYIYQLHRKGKVRRVGRRTNGASLWSTVDNDECPPVAPSLVDLAAAVLAEKAPLRGVEVAVRAQERGGLTLKRQSLSKMVHKAMRRNPHRFKQNDDRTWELVSTV